MTLRGAGEQKRGEKKERERVRGAEGASEGVKKVREERARERRRGHVPLAAADGAGAGVLLLLLHLLEDGLLLDFDEIAALLLSEGEPELLDALALLGGAGGPYL